MLVLGVQDVELVLEPWLGGSVASCKWRGLDVLRPRQGLRNVINSASFPLVPFCNRIAHGQIIYKGKGRNLPITPGGLEPDHALHGIGWISPWAIQETDESGAVLSLRHDGTLWPWRFEAEQRFELLENGFVQSLSITNCDHYPMPTGLGFHPHFPRQNAILDLEATGLWKTGADRLPERYVTLDKAPDWLSNAEFDDCVTRSSETVSIHWPTHRLNMTPSANLPFVHVYTPRNEDFFCVEPVSHIPDAVNNARGARKTGLVNLEPGASLSVDCRFEVEATR